MGSSMCDVMLAFETVQEIHIHLRNWPTRGCPQHIGTLPPNKKWTSGHQSSMKNKIHTFRWFWADSTRARYSNRSTGFHGRFTHKSTPKLRHAKEARGRKPTFRDVKRLVAVDRQQQSWRPSRARPTPCQAIAAQNTYLVYLQILKARYPLFRHDATLHVVQTG